jgi:hypothetical protein
MTDYPTWYEFKRVLEKETGHRLANATWLQVKPAAPLPWAHTQMRSAKAKLLHHSKDRLDTRGLAVVGHVSGGH